MHLGSKYAIIFNAYGIDEGAKLACRIAMYEISNNIDKIDTPHAKDKPSLKLYIPGSKNFFGGIDCRTGEYFLSIDPSSFKNTKTT